MSLDAELRRRLRGHRADPRVRRLLLLADDEPVCGVDELGVGLRLEPAEDGGHVGGGRARTTEDEQGVAEAAGDVVQGTRRAVRRLHRRGQGQQPSRRRSGEPRLSDSGHDG